MSSGTTNQSAASPPEGWKVIVDGLWQGHAAPAARADVVFVHGLGAHWERTWRGKTATESWMKWLGADLGSVNVYALEYEVARFGVQGAAMPLLDRAKNLLDRLTLGITSDLPLVFVCHSMGGLHVKKMLELASRPGSPPKWLQLSQRIEGVVFFSTPHQGSPLAERAKGFPLSWFKPTVAIADLLAHTPQLADLHDIFCNFVHANDVKVHSYFERDKTTILRFWPFPWKEVVVDRDSSHPHIMGAQHVMLDGDHSSICQLESRTAQAYAGVRKFIAELLPASGVATHSRILFSRRPLPPPPYVFARATPSPPTFVNPTVPSPSNLPTLSRTIVPRPDVTERIHAALLAGTGAIGQAAASSHGGYGKTVSALLYANEKADAYPGGRFFLSMENADFVSQLASLAPALGLTVPNDTREAAQIVKTAIESPRAQTSESSPSLLILDNVTDAKQWEAIAATGLLPRGACRVLTTTRATSLPQTTPVKIGALTVEQAREVFARHAEGVRDHPTTKTADAITRLVGGMAVAVAAIAATARLNPEEPWEDVYRTLVSAPVSAFPDVDPAVRAEIGHDGLALADQRRTLYAIDAALDSLSPLQRRAVQYAALLPEDMAPSAWLVSLIDADLARTVKIGSREQDPLALAPELGPDGVAQTGASVVAGLRKLDVLSPADDAGNLLSLHRLWHARVKERAVMEKLDTAPLLLAIAFHARSRHTVIVGGGAAGEVQGIDNPAALTDQSLRWELAPLVSVCEVMWARARGARDSNDEVGWIDFAGAAAALAAWLAPVLRMLGRLNEAAECLLPVRAHQGYVEVTMRDEQMAACLSNLALIQQDQGDLSAARASMERAIAIDKKHFAPDHPTLATSYSNLALIQQDQGDLSAARASIERAIAIEAKHFAPDHPTFATRYSNLAMIQRDQGDLPGARASMERAIAIQMKCFAADRLTFATSYSNFAMIQKDQGDLPGARASMERAIAIDQKHFTPDHPTFATKYSNLATVQQVQGDLPGARASMERAIAIQEKHFAPDHPTFATRYSNLATIQRDQGDLPGARASMERAIAIDQKHFTPDHPTFATKYSNLAMIQRDQGDLPGARASMERALAIEEKHFAPDHPTFAISYSNIATIQHAQGDLPGARASMERAIAIKLKHFDADHPNLAISYSNLARICIAEGSIPEAVALWRKAYPIRLKALGPDHPYTKGDAAMLREYDPPGP